ncbi:MAG TPA: sulfatase [Planctomycetota bacterium]|nr:sulfatase [Planctomycetota bacterium]
MKLHRIFAFLALSVISSCAGPQAAAPAKWNVVLLLADDLGWRDLGCTGSPFYETPSIDRLAVQGMRFTQNYAACNVCSPTRASILTGKHPARLHTTNFFGGNRKGLLLPPEYRQSLPAEEITLAGAFRHAGYRTAIAGKWHLGGKGSLPADHGFDVVLGAETKPAGGPPQDPHYSTQLATQGAEFIEQSKDRPFFLYLAFHAPHVGLKTRPDLQEKYRRKAAALATAGPREVDAGFGFKARAVQDHPVYAGMVEELDQSVDRVLRTLDALGLAERTIVVFTSDNGGLSTAEGSPTSNLPLRAGKGWNYEGGLRVPLIVRVPGRVQPGSLSNTPVISTDLYPTLLELAGITPPPGQALDAESLVPLLEARGGLPDRPLTWHYPHYSNQGGRPSGALRSGSWKLVEWFEDGRVELFDLAADPGEERDLAPSQPERAAALRMQLADWRRAVGAQMPTPNPKPVDPFPPQKPEK